MNEKLQLIILFLVHLALLIYMVHTLIEMRRPRYLKPKSFFKMHDSETGILAYTAENGVQVTHQYITNMFVDKKELLL